MGKQHSGHWHSKTAGYGYTHPKQNCLNSTLNKKINRCTVEEKTDRDISYYWKKWKTQTRFSSVSQGENKQSFEMPSFSDTIFAWLLTYNWQFCIVAALYSQDKTGSYADKKHQNVFGNLSRARGRTSLSTAPLTLNQHGDYQEECGRDSDQWANSCSYKQTETQEADLQVVSSIPPTSLLGAFKLHKNLQSWQYGGPSLTLSKHTWMLTIQWSYCGCNAPGCGCVIGKHDVQRAAADLSHQARFQLLWHFSRQKTVFFSSLSLLDVTGRRFSGAVWQQRANITAVTSSDPWEENLAGRLWNQFFWNITASVTLEVYSTVTLQAKVKWNQQSTPF